MKLTTVRILWAGIFGSTVLMLGVVLEADFDRHVDLQAETFGALSGVALTIGALSLVLPSRLYRAALLRLALPTTDVPIHDAVTPDYRSPARTERVFRDLPAARTAVIRAFQTPFLFGAGLAEAVAILGLVVALQRMAPSAYALPFFAVAWVLLAVRFPTTARVVGPVESTCSATLPP
jgi:hypothetical protein